MVRGEGAGGPQRGRDRSDPMAQLRHDFGRKIQTLLLQKRWKQADLARAAGLPRDSISSYIRGNVMPTRLSLEKVATALGVSPDYLMPELTPSVVDLENPAFDLKVSASRPGKAWLRINRQVSFATAARISEMLAAEDAEDDAASRK